LNQKLPELDKGLASLFHDLAERGLLESTIVWVEGEFGRTPRIMWEPPWDGGRGHYGKAFCGLIGGGGFKGGFAVGSTDKFGESVAERPIYPWDLAESMRLALGISPKAKFQSVQGEQLCVSPFETREVPVKETGGILKEIMS